MRRENRSRVCFLGTLSLLGLIGCFGKGVPPTTRDGGTADRGENDASMVVDSKASVGGQSGATSSDGANSSSGAGGAASAGAPGANASVGGAVFSGTAGATSLGGNGGSNTDSMTSPFGTGGKISTGGATPPASGGSDGGLTTPVGSSQAAGTSGGTPDAGVSDTKLGVAIDAPATLAPIGAKCSVAGDCATGNCVDGLCCDKPCSGCNACSKAMTGKDDGSCAPVLNGNDPHEACADETTASPAKLCGNDGTCDGKGACRKAGAGQKCGSASCSADGNTFTPEPKCDGSGACIPSTFQNCAPYQCAVTGCAKNCSKQADCDTGTYCNITTSTCAAQKTNGTAASQTYECQSGIIANGVCCKTECGECNSCSTGTCTPLTAGTACGGGGKVCVSGTCQAGCWITGQYASSGATSSTNTCQSCQPAISTSGWSTKGDGAECGTGKTCLTGSCKCTTGTDCGSNGCINVNGNDNNHCGSCTNVCPAGQSCASGKCSCVKGAPACGGCLAWDFESGSGATNGWVVGGEPGALAYGNSATNVQISSTRTNPSNSNSRYSLAVPVAAYDSHMFPAAVAVPLCQAGTAINLAGYTLTAAVYLAGPVFDSNGSMHVNTYGPGGVYDWGIQLFAGLKSDDWNYLNYTFTQNIQVDHVSIQLDANEYWVGTMYIDDVIIAGP